MSHSTKVSVIVPVYNVEPYLRRCLDSLVNQTLKDIEIICINDCSPDNSLIVLKKYAKADNRIKIIDFEKNQGVSAARNAGIKIARGEYVGTIDPDDYIDLDYYEKLYLKAKKTNADVVHANLKAGKVGSDKEYVNSIKKMGKIYSLSSHCLAIYRMDLLLKYSLEYPRGIKYSEDLVFLAKALFFANKVESVNNVFYHYIRRDDSASVNIGVRIRKFYGMPLTFDFINKTITNKKEYGHFFCHFFCHFFGNLCYLLPRIAPEWRKVFVQDMIEIYKKRKYPIIWGKKNSYIEDYDLEDVDALLRKIINNLSKPYDKIRIGNLQNRYIYIWGTGVDGPKVLMQCESNDWKISAFLDSNQNVKEFKGYKVKRPEQVLNKLKKDFFIIIASRKYGKEIAKTCRDFGLKRGIDFWKPKSTMV